MSTLLYNSSLDTRMTRVDMRNIPIPAPMGPRHHPYSFADFADNTVSSIERNGYIVTDEDFAVQKDGQRFFGILKVSNISAQSPIVGSVAAYRPDWSLVIGVRGANDQSIARGLVVGSQVMVCSNLCFSGDLGIWKRKQTTNVEFDMPTIIGSAVSQLDKKNEELTVNFDSFNTRKITRDSGDRILMDILRLGGLSASQFERAVNQWDELPKELEEHAANGRTLWWLFNACTHGLKPTGVNSNHSDKADQSAIIYNRLVADVESREAKLLMGV